MKYHLSGSEIVADRVHPAVIPTSKTQPISFEAMGDGPSSEDIVRLGRGVGEPLILADRYRLLRRLGGGGMGSVYLAQDLERGRRSVAVKILDPGDRDLCQAIERFLWEARLARRIRHPNVVEAHDYGSTPSGVVYMIMECLDGRDLQAIVRARGGLSWRWVRTIMAQVCAGVSALHQIGVVHRDLKSSNCFYVKHESVIKILDLGIAALEERSGEPTNDHERTIVGTPEYMSPEQIRGDPVDRRSDVYSAGILVYEILSGRTPFAGCNAEEVFAAQLEHRPPPLAELAPKRPVPARLDALLRKALAKRPRDRFQSMAELAGALDTVEALPFQRALI